MFRPIRVPRFPASCIPIPPSYSDCWYFIPVGNFDWTMISPFESNIRICPGAATPIKKLNNHEHQSYQFRAISLLEMLSYGWFLTIYLFLVSILNCTQRIHPNVGFLAVGRLRLLPCHLGKSLEYCNECDVTGSGAAYSTSIKMNNKNISIWIVTIFLVKMLQHFSSVLKSTWISNSYAVWIFCFTAVFVVKSIIASIWFNVIITKWRGFRHINIWYFIAITIKSYSYNKIRGISI